MPRPVNVRETHTIDVSALVIGAKNSLNLLLVAARSDNLTLIERLVLSEELTGMWEQVVDICNRNRVGLDRLEQDADGEETSAAETTSQAA
jgi:hypothetical protein